ncbi:M14 metallopeptidase family protein [uncultured Algibacter sp.]|uniref:M14 family metallopeptidase n=1 Tax=uncultured Algibacter sp. TaxID=298659 RepID=UPI002633F268|nr:M14 metallopeptidase family protein [uncultured Algibacter sp.]
MQVEYIKNLFLKYTEKSLSHRYITNKHIEHLLENLSNSVHVETIGKSVLDNPIYGLKIGNGDKRLLMWSQMHGNESTTTKALFDLLNTLLYSKSELNYILESCTLYIIPILNPDGAFAYTRINANEVDLNRDAQNLTQPESKVLRTIFDSFKPHFCYNLHGQRTIFSAGTTDKSATVSFLAPAQDETCTITPNRKIAMEVIGVMNNTLQKIIPGQVGVYDDAFNLNCVGDTFQNENVPTILFEAGHFANDYARDLTRELIYTSYLSSLDYISKTKVTGNYYESYFLIPENDKCFFDVIIRNALVNNVIVDIGIQFQERLIKNKVEFIPRIEKIERLTGVYAHKEIEANGAEVYNADGKLLKLGYENVCVILNNEKKLLLSK